MAKYVTIQVSAQGAAARAGGRRASAARSAALRSTEGELERNLRVCPHCSLPLPAAGSRARGPAGRQGHASPSSAKSCARAIRCEFVDLQALPGAHVRGAGQDRPDRGVPRRRSADLRPAGRAGRAGLQVPGRLHGLGGGRALLPSGSGGRRAAPASGRRGRLRRGAHAGGPVLAHADGQDRRVGAAARARPGCPTSPSSPIPPRAACSPASPPWPTSSSPSRERS